MSQDETIEAWRQRERRRKALRELYQAAGGTFHGPHVEHAHIEEQAFWRFLDQVIEYAKAEPPATDWKDRDSPETPLIDAAHPMQTGDHETYAEAMRLVGDRHSKDALVDLVNWLLKSRAALGEALTDAAIQFRYYEQQHLAKTPPDNDKAKTNADMAERMEAALAAYETETT